MWKTCATKTWAGVCAVSTIIGSGGWPDSSRVWLGWMVALHPVAAGMLLGAGALGLALFVVARWGTLACWNVASLTRTIRTWSAGQAHHCREGRQDVTHDRLHETRSKSPLGISGRAYDNEGVTLIVSVPDRYRLVFRDCDVRWGETEARGEHTYLATRVKQPVMPRPLSYVVDMYSLRASIGAPQKT